MDLVRADWQGHAAAAAEGYFKNLAATLDSYRQGLEQLRDEYARTAKGVADAAKAAADAISDMMDNVFWAAVAAAAGGVLAATVVGPALAADRRRLLELVAGKGRNPVLAEMAKALLAGQLTPRAAMASAACGEALHTHVRYFITWYQSLSEVERDEVAAVGENALTPGDVPVHRQRPLPERQRSAEEEAPYDEIDWKRR
ncbi:hypothetical protein [Amycolatopsis sp. GM8]|uniref:hypothetical protein n=1 Tax=Amycolatopsis sp. GM8 TaxID=2896530 RepID=UPI001F163751|nr:hypothetical protein [Amycolatopsis sp. GM8]